MHCIFVGINCCAFEPLTIYFLLKLKSLQRRDMFLLFFSKPFDWAFIFFIFFSSNKPIFGGLIPLRKNHFSL
jgi:hypothetical protein